MNDYHTEEQLRALPPATLVQFRCETCGRDHWVRLQDLLAVWDWPGRGDAGRVCPFCAFPDGYSCPQVGFRYCRDCEEMEAERDAS